MEALHKAMQMSKFFRSIKNHSPYKSKLIEQDLIAFLKWVGEIDLNGSPPEPDKGSFSTNVVTASGSVAAEDKPSKWSLCSACHSLGGSGGNVGPALDGVGNRFDAEYLNNWISDPQTVKPGTAMPKLPLTDTERQEMVEFLSKQK